MTEFEPKCPLRWPAGEPRAKATSGSPFKVATRAGALAELMREMRLLGAKNVIVSSNIPIHSGGLMYSDGPDPRDAGVAVYFDLFGARRVIACDAWARVRDNLHALALTVGAMRGTSRWGATKILERAFRGFAALGPAPATGWREVLELAGLAGITPSDVERAHRRLALETHPDRPNGDGARMAEINRARDEALAELGGTR